MKAKLGAEVGDPGLLAFISEFVIEPGFGRDVLFEVFDEELKAGHVDLVFEEEVNSGFRELVEELDGVVFGFFPQIAVGVAEEVNRFVMPSPAEIIDEGLEGFEFVGQFPDDFKGVGVFEAPHWLFRLLTLCPVILRGQRIFMTNP